jgi:hypothetical protein
MTPLKPSTAQELIRYQQFKQQVEHVLPLVSDPPGLLSYNFTYPRSDQEARDLDSVRTNPDLVFIKDNLFTDDQKAQLDQTPWCTQQHGALQAQMQPNMDAWLRCIGTQARSRLDLPLIEFLIRDAVQALREQAPDTEFTYFHGAYYTTQDHRHVGDQIHRDFHRIMAGWTALYHLTGSSGATLMFDDFVPALDKKPSHGINFRQGRRILFPGLYAHRADIPEPGDTRVIAVVRFQIKSHLNDQILAMTPEIAQRYQLNLINHENQPQRLTRRLT